MSGNGERVSTTEDTPATPGWVESELDEILAGLPRRPSLSKLRAAYLDCLAGIGGAVDMEAAHDRCRATFLEGLGEDGIAAEDVRALDHRLAALEAEITTRT